jgi:membrane protein required for colicin V production
VFAGLNDPALSTLAGCVVIFVGVLITMALLNMVVRSMVKALGLSVSDRILGMIFGLVRGVLVCMVLVGLGGMTSAPTQSWWKDATLAAPMETVVTAVKPWLPDDLAKRIRFS